MRLLVLCSLLATLSPLSLCERRNPEVCSNDPGFECEGGQFCSIPDGQNSGTCIQAECGTGLAACPVARPLCQSGRCVACVLDGDCSAASTATPVCVAGTCVACRDSSQCRDANKKVCDASTHTCRGCQLHSECSPGVCAKDDTFAMLATPIVAGTCVDASMVNEVDTSCGAGCALQSVLQSVTAAKPYVRVNRYTSNAKITVPALPAGLPTFYVIGPMADSAPTTISAAPQQNLAFSSGTALEVPGGAHIALEGMVISGAKVGIDCVSTSMVPGGQTTRLRIIRSLLAANQQAIKASARCELDIDQTWLGKGPSPAFAALSSSNDATLLLDSTQLRLTNSVLWHNGKPTNTFGGIKVSDTAGLQPSLHIVNSTFAKNDFASAVQQVYAIDCDYATNGNLAIVNTLFWNEPGPTGGYTYVNANCRPAGSTRAVASNEAALTGVGSVTLPEGTALLVDNTNGDLHLRQDAPMTVTGGGVTSFTDGAGRVVNIPRADAENKPRGATSVSIGAFERAH